MMTNKEAKQLKSAKLALHNLQIARRHYIAMGEPSLGYALDAVIATAKRTVRFYDPCDTTERSN